MRLLLLSLALATLLLALFLAQGPPVQFGPLQTAAGEPADQAGRKPSSTVCTNQDALFADRFSTTYLVLGGVATLLLTPMLLPPLLGYRQWWLTRPLFRWVCIGLPLWMLILLLAIAVPQLVLAGSLPRGWLNFSYGLVPPEYVDCVDVPVRSKGVLFGFLGDEGRVVIAQEGSMWLGALLSTLVWCAAYGGLHALFRRRLGTPGWPKRGG